MAEKKVKIGFPRALFFYDYYPFCKHFFEGLGADVVVSRPTDKELMQKGLKVSINEFCIPIKMLYAHVLDLKEKKVDYIFLPYVITLDKKTFMCPKLIASPDIIKNNIEDITLIGADIDFNNFYSSFYESLKEILTKINPNPVKIYQVYNEALLKQKDFEKYREVDKLLFEEAITKLKGKKIESKNKGNFNIAVIGHPYIINDDYINAELIKKLNSMNVKVYTTDMISKKDMTEELKYLERTLHWNLANNVLSSALYYSKKEDIQGIIYITPFGCSPDALMKETMINEIGNKKPILTITIDEHTGEAGLITRIEAFLDMIKQKKTLNQNKNTDWNKLHGIIDLNKKEVTK